MQRTGIVDRTVDREFDDEYERFKLYVWFEPVVHCLTHEVSNTRLEKKVEKLTKEAKGYLDSLRGNVRSTLGLP